MLVLLWTPNLKDSDLMDIYFWMKEINYEWSLWLIIWSSFVESVEVSDLALSLTRVVAQHADLISNPVCVWFPGVNQIIPSAHWEYDADYCFITASSDYRRL